MKLPGCPLNTPAAPTIPGRNTLPAPTGTPLLPVRVSTGTAVLLDTPEFIWEMEWSATVTAFWESPPWRAGLQHTKDTAGAGRVKSPLDLGEGTDKVKIT